MRLGEGPAREKVRRGGWILAALAVAALAVFAVDEIQRELAEGPALWVVAEETGDIRPGAPVWLAGHRVGRVSRVELRPPTATPAGRVLIRATLRGEAAGRLRADATASVESPGLLEPPVVSLRPGSPDAPPYDFGDTLRARPVVTPADLRAGLGRARAALDTLRRSEARLLALAEAGPGTVARWRGDPELQRRLGRLQGELAEAARRAREASTAARTTVGGDVLADLRATLSAARRLADRAARSGRRWSELGPRLESLGSRAERVRRTLAEARGSAGRFLHDEALARELERLRARVRSVRAELLAAPWRWLRLRLF